MAILITAKLVQVNYFQRQGLEEIQGRIKKPLKILEEVKVKINQA